MITQFNGNTRVPVFNLTEDELQVMNPGNGKILLNRKTGGWVFCEDMDLIEVLSPLGPSMETAEFLYSANIIKKNGDYIFNYVDTIVESKKSCFHIFLTQEAARNEELSHLADEVIKQISINLYEYNTIYFYCEDSSLKQLPEILKQFEQKKKEHHVRLRYCVEAPFLEPISHETFDVLAEQDLPLRVCFYFSDLFENQKESLHHLYENMKQMKERNLKLSNSCKVNRLHGVPRQMHAILRELLDTGFETVVMDRNPSVLAEEETGSFSEEKDLSGKVYDFFIQQTYPEYKKTSKLLTDTAMLVSLNNVLQPFKLYIRNNIVLSAGDHNYLYDHNYLLRPLRWEAEGYGGSPVDFMECTQCPSTNFCADAYHGYHFRVEDDNILKSGKCRLFKPLYSKILQGLCSGELDYDFVRLLSQKSTDLFSQIG